MPVAFYRYLSDPWEVAQIKNERKIQTLNPNALGTWYSPNRYEDPNEARKELALYTSPTHRLGPIPADQMPDFYIGLRPAAPYKGQPGGGVEASTKEPVWVFGLYDFSNNCYDF